jgi:DNA-binding CsgD family transcriptional regulator
MATARPFLRKLGVKSKTGAVVYAVRWGLLS